MQLHRGAEICMGRRRRSRRARSRSSERRYFRCARPFDAERRRTVATTFNMMRAVRRARPLPLLAGCLLRRRPPPDERIRRRRAGPHRDKDALFSRSTRHLFAAPWRDKTLFGVWHRHFSGAAGHRPHRARRNRPLDRRTELGLSGTAAISRRKLRLRTAAWFRSARRRPKRN